MARTLDESVQAKQIVQEFEIGASQVCSVTRHFVQQMKDGLVNQCTWQLPTYVRSMPTGREMGRFLAVDLGGSNCRICLVDLHGDTTFTVVRRKYTVPVDARVNASYRPIFSFIAEKMADFLDAHLNSKDSNIQKHKEQRYHLGFTFSFNCEQTSLSRGTLIRWDKGWDIPDAVGRDPCAMLQEAIDDLELPVHVSVLANDSVGTLLARSYSSGQCGSTLAAVIFGTGTNAAYVEKMSNVRRTNTKAEEPGDIMVINTEWGCLDDKLEVLPMTPYDHELDAKSIDPGSQIFEKLVSGMYLGELLRFVIVQLLDGNALDMHVNHESAIFRKGGIDSSFLSQLASADCSCPENARMIITKTLTAEDVSLSDVRSVQTLAGAIARRAARLAGASLAAIIIQSGRLATARPDTKLSKIKVEEYLPRLKPHRLSSIGGFLGFCKPLGLLLRRVLAFFGMSSFLTIPASWGSRRFVSSAVDDIPEEDIIDIGADGSLVEFYPTFETDMREAMREIPEISSSGERRIRIGLAKDGSGVGAALMAQAALQEES